jgi:hypothetical protein
MTDFIEAQAHAWSEIREWAEEAEAHPLIPLQPGGSWDGPGASVNCTEGLREELPRLLYDLGVQTMLDAACGDWNWMQMINLHGIHYTGWDVDPGRIRKCAERAGQVTLERGPYLAPPRFVVNNMLTVEVVPHFDLILCRDFLGHLTNDYISGVLDKFQASGSQWLLATTYPESDNEFTYNPDNYVWLGYMEHPVNLEEPPFSLRKLQSIQEAPGPGGVLTVPRELGLFPLGESQR